MQFFFLCCLFADSAKGKRLTVKGPPSTQIIHPHERVEILSQEYHPAISLCLSLSLSRLFTNNDFFSMALPSNRLFPSSCSSLLSTRRAGDNDNKKRLVYDPFILFFSLHSSLGSNVLQKHREREEKKTLVGRKHHGSWIVEQWTNHM